MPPMKQKHIFAKEVTSILTTTCLMRTKLFAFFFRMAYLEDIFSLSFFGMKPYSLALLKRIIIFLDNPYNELSAAFTTTFCVFYENLRLSKKNFEIFMWKNFLNINFLAASFLSLLHSTTA